MPHSFLRRDEDAANIDGEHPFKVAFGELPDLSQVNDAGVIHQDIQTSEFLDRLSDCAFCGVRVSAVRVNSERLTSAALDGLDNFTGLIGRRRVGEGYR